MELIKEYRNLIEYCEGLDYSDQESVFDFAEKLSYCSWELALIIMINIIIADPKYLNDSIYDHIFIVVEAEGNINTYSYIEKKRQISDDKLVIASLERLLKVLERKYEKMGIILAKR